MAAAVRVHPARKRRWRRPLLGALAVLVALVGVAAALPWDCAALPDEASVLNHAAHEDAAAGRGRAAFYTDDFAADGSFTAEVGLLAGPLRPWGVLRALIGLRGAGTTNLRVALAEDATIGGQAFARGATIDTGLDVAAGSFVPLGVTVHVSRLRVRVGITCALCHSTVDPETRRVIHGAANRDLRLGLLLALAGGSAALAGGDEEAADRALLLWPPGTFDAVNDGVAAPVRIPDLFGRDGRGERAGVVLVGARLHPFGAAARPGAGELARAMAGWLVGLAPPEVAVDAEAAARGRLVFAHAGCERCHAGAPAVGREGAPGLLGLWWRAPYLRDGGLAVGTGEGIVGVGELWARELPIDPRASLRALLDRDLRARVIAANRTDAARWQIHVRGDGHAFWVDPAAGFSPAEQQALIEFLLSLRPAGP